MDKNLQNIPFFYYKTSILGSGFTIGGDLNDSKYSSCKDFQGASKDEDLNLDFSSFDKSCLLVDGK